METKDCGTACSGHIERTTDGSVPALLQRLRTLVERLDDSGKHNPNWALQPRVPAGTAEGGRWSAGGGFGQWLRTGLQPVGLPLLGLGRRIIERNPHPDDPECVKEWQEAQSYCLELFNALNKDPTRNIYGPDYNACLLGQVSERCGGNPVDRAPRTPPVRRPWPFSTPPRWRKPGRRSWTPVERYMTADDDRLQAGLERGLALFSDKQYEAALLVYNALIAAYPDCTELFFRRGGVYFLLKRYDESIADRDRAEALGRRNAQLYFVRAMTKSAAGYFRLAIEDFEKAEAHDDDGYFGDILRLERADCYVELGMYGMAIAECMQVDDNYLRPNWPGAVGAKHRYIAAIKKRQGH